MLYINSRDRRHFYWRCWTPSRCQSVIRRPELQWRRRPIDTKVSQDISWRLSCLFTNGRVSARSRALVDCTTTPGDYYRCSPFSDPSIERTAMKIVIASKSVCAAAIGIVTPHQRSYRRPRPRILDECRAAWPPIIRLRPTPSSISAHRPRCLACAGLLFVIYAAGRWYGVQSASGRLRRRARHGRTVGRSR